MWLVLSDVDKCRYNSSSNKAVSGIPVRDNPESLHSSILATALSLARALNPLLHRPARAMILCCTTVLDGPKQSCTVLSVLELGKTQTLSRCYTARWPMKRALYATMSTIPELMFLHVTGQLLKRQVVCGTRASKQCRRPAND